MSTDLYSPTQEERIVAAVAHACILLPLTGVLGPIVIWATQKEKSAYIAFQAIQAMAFQFTLILAWFLGGACYMASFLVMFGSMPLVENSSVPGGEGIFLLSMFFPFVVFGLISLVALAFILTGIIAAIYALQGKPFRYPFLGQQIERFLEKRPAAGVTA